MLDRPLTLSTGADRKNGRRLVLAVSLCILFVLAGMLLGRVQEQSAQVEAAMMLTVLSQLEQALLWKSLEKTLQHHPEELKTFVNMNPFEWLNQQPLNYSGNWEENSAENQPGRWYFSRKTSTVIYKVNYTGAIDTDAPKPDELRFKMALDFVDRNLNQRYDQQEDRLLGLRLAPEQVFEWKTLSWNSHWLSE